MYCNEFESWVSRIPVNFYLVCALESGFRSSAAAVAGLNILLLLRFYGN